MKFNLNTTQAAQMLLDDDNSNWSPLGARALVEYFEECEEETGVDFTFNRIDIRCAFSEYETALKAAGAYGFDPGDEVEIDDREESALEWLRDRTSVVEFDGGVIVEAF